MQWTPIAFHVITIAESLTRSRNVPFEGVGKCDAAERSTSPQRSILLCHFPDQQQFRFHVCRWEGGRWSRSRRGTWRKGRAWQVCCVNQLVLDQNLEKQRPKRGQSPCRNTGVHNRIKALHDSRVVLFALHVLFVVPLWAMWSPSFVHTLYILCISIYIQRIYVCSAFELLLHGLNAQRNMLQLKQPV